MIRRPVLAVLVLAAGLRALTPALAADPPVVSTHGYQALIGGMHAHSSYSDGFPGTTPADAFASAKAFGNDFFAMSEHSDNADLPVTANEACLGPAVVQCPDTRPEGLRKWDATGEQADAATTGGFTAIRGFEWSSDRFGHINVYFSRHDANAKADGGYATMESFWEWFERRPALGGGGDGLATFNHPGDKSVDDADPALNWNDFEYRAAADDRMVGLEVYNDDQSHYGDEYVRALDKGWHVGAVGAEDLGHKQNDDWGGPSWAKTVILAERNDAEAIRAAMLARRFYAVRTPGTALDFTVDGAVMGSRLARPEGAPLRIQASVTPGATLQLVTSGGAIVAGGDSTLDTVVAATGTNQWFFVQAVNGQGQPVAYSSPVWVTPDAKAPVGEWLAGDLHIHTCYSHDAWCPPDDDNTGPQPEHSHAEAAEALVNDGYTLSGSVDERFLEASTKGLDYLAITDHNDVRSQQAPGFGGHGVIGVPAYENSLSGHAQMLGATHLFEKGDSSAAAVNGMAEALRGEGGVFQINHPADETERGFFAGCDDPGPLGWGYGFDVRPDTIEVWNIGHFLQPPAPSGNSNDDAEGYWECWLDRGVKVGATGGSDSHWLSTAAAQGPGNPTTWVFTQERSRAGILRALREGRTSVSFQPPVLGSARLSLEADGDGDGTFEAVIGDTVEPGAALRVRAAGLLGQGIVQLRSTGSVQEAVLGPGGEVQFTAPADARWVTASLLLPDAKTERTDLCPAQVHAQTTYCRNHLIKVALTSPIYLGRTAVSTALALATSTKGAEVTATARLTTQEGAPLAGRTVRFVVRDVSATALTDAGGRSVAVLKVPDHERSQTVVATFAGDPPYQPSSASATATWGG